MSLATALPVIRDNADFASAVQRRQSVRRRARAHQRRRCVCERAVGMKTGGAVVVVVAIMRSALCEGVLRIMHARTGAGERACASNHECEV